MTDVVKSDPAVTGDVVAAIETGKVDIARVFAAIRAVIEASDAVIVWELDLAAIPPLAEVGLVGTVSGGELTIGEQVSIVDAVGVGWQSFDPRTDQRHARALLVALILGRTDITDVTVAGNVADTVTTDQFDAAYRIVEQRPADPT